MRQAMQDAGIPCPKFLRSDESIDLDQLADFTFPIIVKPTDRSGSRSIMKLDSIDGVRQAIASACGTSFEKKAIVEEYLVGDEYSMETISYQGNHRLIAVTKKYTTGAPHFIETGHCQPSDLSAQIIRKATDMVFRALDALHIENSAGHSEFRVDEEGKIRIIEIGARMGGDCIGSDLVYLSTGQDYIKMVIDVACGKAPIINDVWLQHKAEIRFLFDQKDVEEFEKVRTEKADTIYRVSEFDFSNAGNVNDSSTRIGYYISTDCSTK